MGILCLKSFFTIVVVIIIIVVITIIIITTTNVVRPSVYVHIFVTWICKGEVEKEGRRGRGKERRKGRRKKRRGFKRKGRWGKGIGEENGPPFCFGFFCDPLQTIIFFYRVSRLYSAIFLSRSEAFLILSSNVYPLSLILAFAYYFHPFSSASHLISFIV